MSESTAPHAASGVGNPDPSAAGVFPSDPAQWEAVMQQMAKQGGMQGLPPTFAMAGFPQFVYPHMMPGLLPGYALPGAEGEPKTEGQGSGEDDTEEEGNDSEDDDSSGKDRGRPKRKRAARTAASKKKAASAGDGVVKSNSNAALAMLAGAAATKPNPAALAAQAAAMHNIEGMWAMPGIGQSLANPSSMDVSKMMAEAHAEAQQQQYVTGSTYEGVTDERELKKMRRKQSNRDSARRSRLRKQAECEALAIQLKEMTAENARLKEEKMQMQSQIEILNAKLSMGPFASAHVVGQQAGDAAKQSQDVMAMMAQMMQMNGGAMMGIPPLDGKAMEGDEAAMMAAAVAAATGAVAPPAEAVGVEQEQQEQESAAQ